MDDPWVFYALSTLLKRKLIPRVNRISLHLLHRDGYRHYLRKPSHSRKIFKFTKPQNAVLNLSEQSSGSYVFLTQTLTSILHTIGTPQDNNYNIHVSSDCPSLSGSAALTGSKQDWIQDPNSSWRLTEDSGR